MAKSATQISTQLTGTGTQLSEGLNGGLAIRPAKPLHFAGLKFCNVACKFAFELIFLSS